MWQEAARHSGQNLNLVLSVPSLLAGVETVSHATWDDLLPGETLKLLKMVISWPRGPHNTHQHVLYAMHPNMRCNCVREDPSSFC